MASPMGTVHLTGTRDGKFSYNTLVFLQGFCVMKLNYCPFDEVNIAPGFARSLWRACRIATS